MWPHGLRWLALVVAVTSCTQSPHSEAVATHALALESLPPEDVDRALERFRRAESPALPDTVLRARAMRTLIVTDPERALKVAMPGPRRAALAPHLQPYIERWVDGVADLDVIAGTAEDGEPAPEAQRFLTVGGETLRAYVTGPRFERRSRKGIRVHAVALGDVAAISDRPTRLMFPGEPDDEGLPYRSAGQCPVSRKNVPRDATRVHAGDALYELCMPDHVAAFDGQLGATEDQAESAATPASAWTTGPKTVLFMRVDFDDLTGEPLTQAAAQSLIDSTASSYFSAQSFGQTTLSATVTPVLRLPQPSTFYRMNDNYYGLRTAAILAAADAGYTPTDYSFDIVAFKALYSGWAGRGSVGGRGNWLNGNFSGRVTEHELGHNYGVWHANFWSAANSTIIGAGTNQEYGNPFDVMGNGTQHFNAWFKRTLDWVAPAAVATVTASGTYRVQALEQPLSTGLHALKVPRGDGLKDYWVELRQGAPTNRSLFNGVSINWGYPSSTGSHLLDMTPGAPGGVGDSALTYGRTFSDFNRGIHLTPLQKAGTTPEGMDVVVNLGAFPGNRPPTAGMMVASTLTPAVNAAVTFSIAASDPDGDALAYAWDFADDTYVPSSPMATHPFAAQRTYFVRCTVSDMKGQSVTRSVLVTVGTPARWTLEGTVTAGGVAVEGVRVGDASRVSYTDSDGKWALSDVPDASVTLAAAKVDHTFTAGFAQPVVVSGSRGGLDFTGAKLTGYQVSGTVLGSGAMGLGGVTVSDGARSAVTAANGTFTLAGVPNGGHALTATKPGWAYAARPVEVLGANVTGVQFTPSGAGLNGQILGGVMAAATVTDGLRTTTANGSGTSWYWNISGVPSGAYNVTATLPGYTLTPQFTNPVSVTGSFITSLNFNAVAGTTYTVAGSVTTGGVAVPGVVVTDGTRSSTSDSLGRFVLVGVAAGSYTVTPSHGSYSFLPATRMVTVSTANVTAQNFATTVVNPPPTVAMAASAAPSPVTTGSTTVLAVLGADDSGEMGLRYTWSTSFYETPAYSVNGTNAAKTTTVTFSRAGTYPFEVLIEDPGGLSVRSSVTVVVQQSLQAMTVSPASANVGSAATQQFNAQGRDQFGEFMYAGPYTWMVSGGGSITASGLFTAGAIAGGPHTVTVTSSGGLMGTGLVTVTGLTGPTIVTAARAAPSPVTGAATALSVVATDDGGEPALTYTWSVGAGPAAVAFAANGTNAAKATTATFTRAGLYQLVVSVVDGGGNMATSAVDVEVEQTPTTVRVTPPSATVQPGATLGFSASVEDQFGHPLTSQTAVTWSVSGGGAIDAAGVFTAGASAGGPFTVTAAAAGVTGVAELRVAAAPDTQPPVVSIAAPMNEARPTGVLSVEVDATDDIGLAAVGLSLNGTPLMELSALPYVWTVDTATLASGANVLVATARDAAGNVATSSAVRFLVGSGVDAPPVVSLSGAAEGQQLPGVFSVSVAASDDVAVMGTELLVDGAVTHSETSSVLSATLDLPDGAHTLQARAVDTAAQRGESAVVNVTVARTPVAKPPPEQLRGACGCTSGELTPLLLLALVVLRRRASSSSAAE